MSSDDLDPDIAKWLLRIMPDRDPETVEEAREHSRRANLLALESMDPAIVPASDEASEVPAEGEPARP